MLPWLNDTSPDLLADVRDTSLAKLVRDEVLNAILRGDLPPGQRINEPDVAARLRVSRVPVREALRELESTGLVAARKHAGVFVRILEPKEVANLYELRSLLDGHAGRRAAALDRPRRDALVKRLVTLGREMKANARRRDVQAYYAANLAFHWAIVEATDNEPLTRTYQGIVQQLHLSRLRNLSRDVGMKVSIQEHDQIVAALDDGDAALCQRLQEHHVNAAHGRLLETEGRSGADHPDATPGKDMR